MGKKRFAGKQGLNKRQRTPEKFRGGNGRQATKKGRTDEIVPSPSPSSQEELSDVEVPEPVVYREPSMYDNLLTKLGSKSKSLAHEYKRRQRREEGNSDTEEDEDEDEDNNDGYDSIGESDEEDEEDERKLQEHITVGDGDVIEGAESEDESEASTDIEQDSDANAQTADESPACSSSFNVHLGHTLSDAELENLSKKKWKYEWEVPAANMPNCKWMGTGECFLKDLAIDSDHGLKLRLYKPWLDVFKKSGGNDSQQRLFFSLCDSYRDILHCNKKPFYLKGREEDSSIMDAYIMHSLNHVFRTRDLVMMNKTKLNHQENAEKLIVGDEFLDQGFTRPKVLILLPFKSIAKRVIERLIQLTRPAHQGNVDNKDRFNKEYGTEVVEDDDLNGVQNGDLGNFKPHKPSKPMDFQALFSGNTDDHFMIGIKFTRKSIQLYNDFYKADMIVASPLNLITKIGHSEVDKEKDVDYLSSIEVLIIDHADVIAMQNWDHLKTAVQQLNQIPSKQHGTDIMRIRPWYLDGRARFYRQTIVLGSYLNPDMNALFNHHCTSYRGKVKSVCQYKGVLPKVLLQVRQIYERFNPESIVDEDDARFEYFTKKVFPKIKDSLQGGVMLFTSSYFEYVRVRNFLKSQNASFCLLGEYTKQKDISRARVWFFEGTRKIMLYTERAHFYHRYKIRGIQNLIIYSLPERKEMYPEIVNMLEGSHNMSCTVLFSRFDQLRLERIAGTAPAKRMVTSEKAVFVFC